MLTAALAVLAAVLTARAAAAPPALAPFAREATMIAGLYALWQLAGELSRRRLRRARSPARAGSSAPSTPSACPARRACNGADRQRRGRPRLRHLLRDDALRRAVRLPASGCSSGTAIDTARYGASWPSTTLLCLLIQLVPVAPPRLLPGYVDTAAKYGESVYGLGFGADQLSAMPSVHVAWAVLVGVGRVAHRVRPWRWLGAGARGDHGDGRRRAPPTTSGPTASSPSPSSRCRRRCAGRRTRRGTPAIARIRPAHAP